MKYFLYDEKEINYLSEKDPIIGMKIKEIGFVKREINDDLFHALIDSIISQQISTKAAITVKNRFYDKLEEISPKHILKLEFEDIQSCGMSHRKANNIISIAKEFFNNPNKYNGLNELSNEGIIKELIKLNGVGPWTAEMLLMHTFLRKDIISFKDLGIKRGLMHLHNLDEITKEDEIRFKELYGKYATIASFYLWEISRQLVESKIKEK